MCARKTVLIELMNLIRGSQLIGYFFAMVTVQTVQFVRINYKGIVCMYIGCSCLIIMVQEISQV